MSSRYFFSLANQCREHDSPRRSAGLIAPVCAALVMRDCNTFEDCALSLLRDPRGHFYKSLR
jgi:hypothetical protein